MDISFDGRGGSEAVHEQVFSGGIHEDRRVVRMTILTFFFRFQKLICIVVN